MRSRSSRARRHTAYVALNALLGTTNAAVRSSHGLADAPAGGLRLLGLPRRVAGGPAALQKYGMLVTDSAMHSSGSDGAQDSRWSIQDLDQLKTVPPARSKW